MRWVLIALLAGGCVARDPFVCQDNAQCVQGGQVGTCEPTSFCSFPAGDCPSGRRYASYSSDGLRNQCVGAAAPDGGADSAMVDAAAARDGQTDASLDGQVPIDGQTPIDAAAIDAAVVDATVVDARIGAAPTVRLIRNAYYSDYSGTTFKSPPEMSHNGFKIDTAGVVNGDLVIFIGSIDNGGDQLWPNPIAPGFTQLAQHYFGNDGQTYVVAWKLANNEPASYIGTYGPSNGSGSATITLVAVAGVNQSAPINMWRSTDDNTAMSPVVGSSIGVTTTVGNCAIVYTSGADWLGQTGTNTFAPPAGYAVIAQIGDRGGNAWDWTSQQVAATTQAAAGPTGTISGSMTGPYNANPWTVVMAIAPP